MQRRIITTTAAVACAAFVGVGVAGCSDSKADRDPSEVTVVGNGEVLGTPDVLTASVGIETRAADVAGAVAQLNERADAMIAALGEAGVAKEDIQTQQLSIQPEYSSPGQGGGPSVISGYTATNTVKVVVRDLSKASDVLDKAVAAGGDNARLGNVSFDIDDNTDLLNQARDRAFNDAKARAEQYADLSGMSLGDPITIEEVRSGNAPSPEMSRSDSVATFALEPGQQTVSFQVTVKWALD